MFLFMIDWNDFFENDFSPIIIYVVRGIKWVWEVFFILNQGLKEEKKI